MPEYRVEVIDRAYAAVLATKTPAERVAIMDALDRRARSFLADRVGHLFPDATPADREHMYLRRLLGRGAVADLEARG